MRGALLRSLQRMMTYPSGHVHQPACTKSAASTRHVVQQAQSLADAQPTHREAETDEDNSEPEGSSQHSGAGKAKAAGQWAAKAAGSVASAAKTAVTGSNEADENQNPAGSMQQRRTVGREGDKAHERLSEVHAAVKEKWQDGRPVSERYPSMKNAADKQHRTGRTGGPNSHSDP